MFNKLLNFFYALPVFEDLAVILPPPQMIHVMSYVLVIVMDCTCRICSDYTIFMFIF